MFILIHILTTHVLISKPYYRHCSFFFLHLMPSSWRGSMETFCTTLLNIWFKTYIQNINTRTMINLEFLEFLFSPSWAEIFRVYTFLRDWLIWSVDEILARAHYGQNHLLRRWTLSQKNTGQNTHDLQKILYWMVLTLNKQWTVPKKEHRV